MYQGQRWQPIQCGTIGNSWNTNKHVHVIIFLHSVNPYDKAFLAVVTAACRYLSKKPPVLEEIQTIPKPFEDHRALKDDYNCRVFSVNDEVHKFYKKEDSKLYCPNVLLFNKLGISTRMFDLTCDGEWSVLVYPYFNGDHSPTSLSHFRGICEGLKKIYDLGYVHGDIRLSNMIFSEN